MTENCTSLTNSLRGDILLLSTYLAGRHESSFQPQTVDENLDLFAHISILLTIGNKPSHDGQNVSVVTGTATASGIDFLVYTQNRPGHQACVDQSYTNSASETTPGRVNKEGLVQSEREVGDLVCITPVKEAGRKLLDKWDLRTMNKEVEISEWVIHLSIQRASFLYATQ